MSRESTTAPTDSGMARADTAMHVEMAHSLSATLLEEVRRLRATVWRRSGVQVRTAQHRRYFADDHDEHALHFIALDAGLVVAAARACLHEDPFEVPDATLFGRYLERVGSPVGSINRLVVDRPFRGRGLARSLDAQRLASLRMRGCRSVVCWWAKASGSTRLAALMKLGFRPFEPGTSVAGPLGQAVPLWLALEA